MAEKTTNYNLTKPGLDDFYDINVPNANMDIIDEELKKRIPCLATYYPANSNKSADELVDPFALVPVSLEVNSELFNIIGGTFAWVWTNFYIEASVTSRRMQVAMSYNTTDHKMAFRIYGANGWLEWRAIATFDQIPKTAADVGALSTEGGIVKGAITLKKENVSGSGKLNKNHSDTADYGTLMTDYDKDGKHASLNVRAKENVAYFIDNDNNYQELYHAGNKPTAEDVGALLATLPTITDADGSIGITTTGIKIEHYTKDTLNTPYKAGLTTNPEGVIISASSKNVYATQFAFALGGRGLFIRPNIAGSVYDWSEFGDFKSDGSKAMSGKVLNMQDGRSCLEVNGNVIGLRVRETANDDTNSARLTLDNGYGLSRKLFLRITQNGSHTDYDLYGEHHKPTAAEVEAGTFAGQVVANSGGQAVGTSLLRNSKLVSADTNPTVNGEINWTYK